MAKRKIDQDEIKSQLEITAAMSNKEFASRLKTKGVKPRLEGDISMLALRMEQSKRDLRKSKDK